jgi:hypothetical protein
LKDIIKRRTTSLYKQKGVKKYQITELGLHKIIKLKPRSQKLLLDIIKLINSTNDINSLTVKVSYKDLGFKYFGNFQKARQGILDECLMYYKDNQYFINPCYINHYTRRQKDFLFRWFGLTNEVPVIMIDPNRQVG